jgi:hypothetical protein
MSRTACVLKDARQVSSSPKGGSSAMTPSCRSVCCSVHSVRLPAAVASRVASSAVAVGTSISTAAASSCVEAPSWRTASTRTPMSVPW